MIAAAFLGAAFFGAAGYVGALVGLLFVERLAPLDDAPPQAAAPLLPLIAASAAIGAIVMTHPASPLQVILTAIVCMALVAIWIVDARRGIVPDMLSLGPLALILIVSFWQHQWFVFVSAAIAFVPFATAAALSRGRGMGWGDVKLVALGGALLGAPTAILAFALAALAAVAVNYARGKPQGAIAFAPYLAGAIGIAIPFGILR